MWPPFLNVYTQNLGHTDGAVDHDWIRKMLEQNLESMRALIMKVCERQDDWIKIVCDVSFPAKQALLIFPDLNQCYADLQQDARTALAGYLPEGY